MAWKTCVVKFSHSVCSGRNGTPPTMLKMLAPRNVEDEPGEHAHLEADVLAQVVVEPAPELDGLDDRREVVVGQDHRRGLLRDLGAGDAHGDADVGPLERRRVVHAVAGHGDDVALALERVDQADLVLRRDARDDADAVDLVRGLRRRSCAANSAPVIARPSMPELLRDRLGGDRVVAGDHAHLDAGVLAMAIAAFAAGRGGSTMPTSVSSGEAVDQLQQVGVRVEASGSKSLRAVASTRRPCSASRWFSSM